MRLEKSQYQSIQLCRLSQSKKTMIPSDWEVNRLKDLAGINKESIDQSYDQKEIQYIDISSVENYEIEKYEHFHLDDRPSRAQRIVKKSDIVVSTVRPYLRAFAKINDSQPNLVCSTGFAVLRPKNLEDTEFIFNYIKSHQFEVNIVRHMEGMAYPAVTSRIVGDSLIPWPTDRNERIKVGLFLSKVDELIQKTDQVIEQTQRLKKGLMQRLLSKGIGHTEFKKTSIGEIPEGWELIKLKQIVHSYKNGIYKKSHYHGHGIPNIRMFNIKDGKVDSLESPLLEVTEKERVEYNLRVGDLLINRVNSADLVGKSA